jgi:hypothetical protein
VGSGFLGPPRDRDLGRLDLGSDGFWNEDYGWGVRVRRHFCARGRSSVRYGTRLGDLQESWFIFVFQLNTQHTHFMSEVDRFLSGKSPNCLRF